jgi:hypothetical protein
MAFGTILGTTFKWFSEFAMSKLLVSFVIAAVIINFSLPLCQLVVSVSQSVSGIFLGSIGDAGTRIGQILKPGVMLGSPYYEPESVTKGKPTIASQMGRFGCALTGVIAGVGSSPIFGTMMGDKCVPILETTTAIASVASNSSIPKIIGLFFSTLLVFMVTLSIACAVIFALIRIPIIWFLIVLSPLFVLGSILPSTKKVVGKWMEEFVSWNTFLPIFLFFLTFGMFFLSSQGIVERGLGVNLKEGFLDTIGIDFSLVLYYVMATLIFSFGTAAAFQASRALGGSAASFFEKKIYTPATSYRPAWYKGAQQAVTARKEQLYKEGLPGAGRFIYGGKAAEERAKSFAGRFIGLKGESAEERRIKAIAAEKSNFEVRLKTIAGRDEQEKFLKDFKLRGAGTLEQKIAANQLLKEKFDALTNAELFETFRDMGGARNADAVKFASGLSFKDMTKSERKAWYDHSDSNDIKRKVAEIMRNNGEFKDGTENERVAALMQAAKLFGSAERQQQFVKEAGKKDPVAAHHALLKMGAIQVPDPADPTGQTKRAATLTEANEQLRSKIENLDKEGIRSLTISDMSEPAVQDGIIKGFSDDDKLAQQVIKAFAQDGNRIMEGAMRGLRKKAIGYQILDLQARIAGLTATDPKTVERKKKLDGRLADMSNLFSTL